MIHSDSAGILKHGPAARRREFRASAGDVVIVLPSSERRGFIGRVVSPADRSGLVEVDEMVAEPGMLRLRAHTVEACELSQPTVSESAAFSDAMKAIARAVHATEGERFRPRPAKGGSPE